MTEVFVSVGSNVDREVSLRSGLAALRDRFGSLRLSPIYESATVGFKGEDFLNLVIAFDSSETLNEVADALQGIEDSHGRDRSGPRFGPRTLDLDLILFGDRVEEADGVVVPRPEITRYAFVLAPLADLAGDRCHPRLGENFATLWLHFDEPRQPLRRVDLHLE